ncbi:hypothetical protein GLX27_001710 [Malassezia furfur]|uniref:Uncharacterized protein n=1 Tax=Malassezia furfur TaxID=55194 RepID=A0ABY8EQ47_MALFU|nr:hypothetical protein CBS14141_000637 [Malassezia furfur]WFD47064.1 hypothetical protein GLX27_001710 [Malassezia furfur]
MADEKPEVPADEYFYHPPAVENAAEQVTPADLNQHEIAQAEHELEDIVDDRIDDPNMDADLVHDAEKALETGDVKHEVTLGHLIEEDSPYVEVRAAVSNVDDPSMPVNTFRAWFLGTIAVIVVPGLNQFLYLRYPSTTVSGYCVIIFVYPMGTFLAWALPKYTFKTRLGNFSLNPGPFNVKEHSLISIMALMSYQSAYAAGIPAVQRYTLGVGDYGFGYGVLLILSTQLLGLAFASFCRRFLVWPSTMIWPNNLPKATLLNSLHNVKTTDGANFTGMSRYKFFWIVFTVLFFYQFFPTYIFTLLSIGNWFCIAAPNNVILNQMLGTQSGLSLLPLTFDWTVIAYVVDPLATPWWSLANLLGGFIVFFVIACPFVYYYTDSWYGKYLPMFSTSSFDRFGQSYEVSNVVDKLPGGGMVFNADKYNNYSLLYLPSALTISYMLSFASVTGVLVHVGLFHGKTLYRQLRASPMSATDIHNRLMSNYKEAPYLWYLILFLLAFAMGVGGIHGWDTGMNAGHFVLAIVIGAVFMVPIGVIMALSNMEVGLNMISELIIGYMNPGYPIAMMIFKTTMYMITYQGIQFIQDQKLAHYMKVPPRSVFMAQVYATAVGGVVQLAVQTWAFSNIDEICTPHQIDKFNCASYKVFGTASIIWGLIGPAKTFSVGRHYAHLMYGFLFGALAPIPIWLLAKKYPKSGWRMVNMPVIFTGTGNIPPATGVNYLPAILIGFFTQFIWKRKHSLSWSKYNYILSAALNAASAIATVFIFFTLQYPNGPNEDFLNDGWWGNSAWQNTADYNSTAYIQLPDGQAFTGTPLELGQTA